MRPPVFQRLEPRAARFVQLLVEFGHLDPDQGREVMMMAAEAWPGQGRVPLSFIRRVASTAVVTDSIPGGPDTLSSDWALLFH